MRVAHGGDANALPIRANRVDEVNEGVVCTPEEARQFEGLIRRVERLSRAL